MWKKEKKKIMDPNTIPNLKQMKIYIFSKIILKLIVLNGAGGHIVLVYPYLYNCCATNFRNCSPDNKKLAVLSQTLAYVYVLFL